MTITSPHNEQLKQVRKLAGRKWRDKTRTFVAEGEDLIAAADAAGWRPELLLCEAGIEVNRKMLADIAVNDPDGFRRFVELAREGAAA